MLVWDLSDFQYFNIGLHEIKQNLSNLYKDDITKQLRKLKTWENTWRNSHIVFLCSAFSMDFVIGVVQRFFFFLPFLF